MSIAAGYIHFEIEWEITFPSEGAALIRWSNSLSDMLNMISLGGCPFRWPGHTSARDWFFQGLLMPELSLECYPLASFWLRTTN
jgi:hypothetical protein